MAHDRCVRLVSGVSIFAMMATAFPQLILAVFTGELVMAQRGGELAGVSLFVLGSVLLVLPLASTLLLVLRGTRRSLRVFHLLAWGLAGLAAIVLVSLLGVPELRAALWGGRLYLIVAAPGLGMELLLESRRRRIA
jgi:hypothetical protein